MIKDALGKFYTELTLVKGGKYFPGGIRVDDILNYKRFYSLDNEDNPFSFSTSKFITESSKNPTDDINQSCNMMHKYVRFMMFHRPPYEKFQKWIYFLEKLKKETKVITALKIVYLHVS